MADRDRTTSDEIWYPIPGVPGYELSSEMRVRKPLVRWPAGQSVRGCRVPPGQWKIISLCRFRGSLAFSYKRHDGKWTIMYLHRAIAMLAYGLIPDGMIVRHYDDDTGNNYASNLCFGTHADNAADKVRNGNCPKGERCVLSKLTEEVVREIRKRSERPGCVYRDVDRELSLRLGTTSEIKKKKTWCHVT